MKEGRFAGAATLVAATVTLGLAGFAVLSLHHIEERLIVQGQQIRALGEATERLASQVARSGPGTAADPKAPATAEPARVLHPGVPNLLRPNDKRWPAPGARTDGVLTRGWASGDPKGFNALLENSADLGELIETYVGTYLADRNWSDPEIWHGDLATRVEVTDDSRELTIYLRPGVKWHVPSNVDLEGKHRWLRGEHLVTAKDFVFTLDLVMNPQVENGFLKNYYAELESWKALDDHTLVVRWKKKQFLNIEATLQLYPVPEFIFAYDEQGTRLPPETLGIRFNRHWYNNKGYVGSGPYRLATYEAGTRIRLTRSEDFHGDRPAIREISYPIYTDPNQTLLKLKAHELSGGGLTPGQYREEILQHEEKGEKPDGSPFFDGRISCKKIEQPVYRYIGWNADKPLFADRRVRRAMTMAFNRQQIIDNVFVGLGKITTGPYLHASPGYDRSIAPIPFDLAGARKLLAEAGWEDTDGDGLLDKALPGSNKRTPFEFTLLIYGTSKEYGSLANILKEDLLKLGVKMNIDAAEWSLMQKRMEEKRFDAFTGAWALGWETDLFQVWHSSQADASKGSNRVGFRHKEADLVIEKLRETFDPGERATLLRRFHGIVDDEQPYSFFMVSSGVYCWWSDVKDVEFAKVRPVVNTLPWSVARGAN